MSDKCTDRKKLYREIKNLSGFETCLLATVISGPSAGAKGLYRDGQCLVTEGDIRIIRGIEHELKDVKSTEILDTPEGRIFLEPLSHPREIVICGGGHVSCALIPLCKQVGFRVTVLEDRGLYAQKAKDAGADRVVCRDFPEALAETADMGPDTYYVVLTREHSFDMECVRVILKRRSAYVGMMGSHKRVEVLRGQLIQEGYAPDRVEELHAPIGLRIAAETVEEIAISIAAELIQVKNSQTRETVFKEDILDILSGERDIYQRAALATVVGRHGSAPRDVGTRMLVLEDGAIYGTIGGGYAEAKIIESCRSLLSAQGTDTDLVPVDLSGEEARVNGMVCGGKIDVFLEKI